MARISIGIPVYNEERCIADTLTSVIRQLDDYPDIEIVISDNGSTDKTLQNIETTLSQNDKHRNSIKLIKQSQNKGAFSTFGILLITAIQNFFFGLAHTISFLNDMCFKVLNICQLSKLFYVLRKHKALSPRGF